MTQAPQAVVLFMDWTILRMYPPLRHAWSCRGVQKRVPITGENAQRTLFGTIDLKTGHRIVRRRDHPRQGDAQTFLRDLRRRYGSRQVILLLDRASCQTAPATQALAAGLNIALIWLPKQWSELNGMDQLWKELKRAIAANRQYATVDEAADRAERWILGLTNHAALRKASILSENFWLRKLRKNFWHST